MNNLTKSITIALTTAALSTSVSADWWTGWGSNDINNAQKTITGDETKSTSNNFWGGWGHKDTENKKKYINNKTTNASKTQSEISEVEKENISTNAIVKKTSSNWDWWNGWSNSNTQKLIVIKADSNETTDVPKALTEIPEAMKMNASAESEENTKELVDTKADHNKITDALKAQTETSDVMALDSSAKSEENTKDVVDTKANSNETAYALKAQAETSDAKKMDASTKNEESTEVLVDTKADSNEITDASKAQTETSDAKKMNASTKNEESTEALVDTKTDNNEITDASTAQAETSDVKKNATENIVTLIKQLTDNNPKIEISSVKNSLSDSVTYKVSGKADRQTIEKLTALIKSSEAIEINPTQPNINITPQQNYLQPRVYYPYYQQQPIFTQPNGRAYIWYPVPLLIPAQQ